MPSRARPARRGAPETRTPSAASQPDRHEPGTPGQDPARRGHRGGRAVINLRIPLSLGRAAINQVPGISDATSDRIREAIEAGVKGSILEVDDADDGVRISIE